MGRRGLDRDWLTEQARRTMIDAAIDNVLVGIFHVARAGGPPRRDHYPIATIEVIAQLFTLRWTEDHGGDFPPAERVVARIEEFARAGGRLNVYRSAYPGAIARYEPGPQGDRVVVHKAAWN